MIHPDLHQWQVAKKAALAIAAHMSAAMKTTVEVIQQPDGAKRVIIGKRIVDVTSWYGAFCYLHRIRADQIKPQPAPEPIPVATLAPPEQAKPPPPLILRAIHAPPRQDRPDIIRGTWPKT